MKAKFTKMLVIGSVVVAMLSLFGGAVSAQDDGTGVDPNVPAQDGRRDRVGPWDNIARGVIAEVVEQLGLTVEDVTAQMRDGATLSEIIEANGGNVDEIVAGVMAQITERLNEATEERLAQVEEHLTAILNGEITFPRGDRPDRPNIGVVGRQVIAIIATETGLEAQDIVAQVRDGATLAEVIEANGGSVDNVIQTALANITERLAEQVAEGNITQEQADQRLERAQTALENLLNGVRPVRDNA
ncbi:MAG: hypothetical protein RLP44_32905 [Aggregatilineales bacterium]